MRQLIAGQEEALESLMERHAALLNAHLLRLLRDKTEAQDCVQEAFVRVYRYREDFDFQQRFSTWLYTIGFNLARDRLRRQARLPEFISLENREEAEASRLEETLLDREQPPDQRVQSQEWFHLLTEIVATLPDTLRLPLVRYSLEGQSQLEIAAEMDCTAKTVEMRLYHARKRLRQLLEKNAKSMRDFAFPNVITPDEP